MYMYIYIYIYTQEGIRNRTGRTEPNRLILKTGRNQTRNRTQNRTEPPSEKRRPNRVEPGQLIFRIEPNRTDFRKVRNRTEANRTGSFLCVHGRFVGIRIIRSNICVYIYIYIHIYKYIYTHTAS